MRYFWSFIAVLALVTAGLHTLRRSQEGAAMREVSQPTAQAQTPPMGRPAADTPAPMPPVRAETPITARTVAPAPEPEPVITRTPPEPEVIAVTPTEPARSEPAPAPAPSLDALLGVVAEAAALAETESETATETDTGAITTTTVAAAPASVPMLDAAVAANEPAARSAEPESPAAALGATDTAGAAGPVGPGFEVLPDGSLSVEGVGVIAGSGTAQRPFVLDWQALRSLSREYNPRQGQAELPGWVMELDGKFVRVEGNTLLPVVAQTTNELLVMQNPWDGCCIGVPPTPYDAIEVKLAQMTRMGNSPTGFGQVEGVFKVDPYIVSGWLLGLYVIEQASFESASGGTPPGL